ncbi:MAG: AraC family transcriptional regulator [Pseudomonadota bacterium]
MRSLPQDITEEKIRGIDSRVNFESFDAQAPDDKPLATGIIRSVTPIDGLQVMGAVLNGQKGYSAKVGADAALSIELRMLGSSNSKELTGENRKVTVSPNELLLTGSNDYSMWHVIGKPQAQFKTISVRYSLSFLENLSQQSKDVAGWAIDRLNSNANWKTAQTTEMECLANQIIALLETMKPETSLLCNALALKVLVSTWREYTTKHPSDTVCEAKGTDELVAFAQAYIGKNPNTRLTVREIARMCRTSETKIKSLFKEEVGASIGSYILNVRMQNAVDMIKSGVSISNASQALGYSSPEALSKAIKNHFGRPPSEIY